MPILTSDLFVNANQRALDDGHVSEGDKIKIRAGRINIPARLEACATSDPSHIFHGNPPGPHVRIIQMAFEKLRDVPPAGPDQIADEDERKAFNDAIVAIQRAGVFNFNELKENRYGPTTRRIVKAYKEARQIKRTVNSPVDDVVGIQTIRALDTDLNRADGKFAPSKAKPRDIIIKYSGFGEGIKPGSPDNATNILIVREFNTADYMRTHDRLLVISFFGGRDASDPTDNVIKSFKAAREATPDGLNIILSFSAGGFSALNTAAKLTALNFPIEFLGIADGAFFVESNDVSSLDPAKINFVRPIKVQRSLNTFQTLGHDVLRGVGTVNSMGLAIGTEVHGSIPGLTNKELTPDNDPIIKELKDSFDRNPAKTAHFRLRKTFLSNPAHSRAVTVGEDEHDKILRRLLRP